MPAVLLLVLALLHEAREVSLGRRTAVAEAERLGAVGRADSVRRKVTGPARSVSAGGEEV